MKLFPYLIALLLVGGSVTVEIPLSGQRRDLGKITESGARPLRIAIVQMQSLNHDVDANLKKATGFSEQAAMQGGLQLDVWDTERVARTATGDHGPYDLPG